MEEGAAEVVGAGGVDLLRGGEEEQQEEVCRRAGNACRRLVVGAGAGEVSGPGEHPLEFTHELRTREYHIAGRRFPGTVKFTRAQKVRQNHLACRGGGFTALSRRSMLQHCTPRDCRQHGPQFHSQIMQKSPPRKHIWVPRPP